MLAPAITVNGCKGNADVAFFVSVTTSNIVEKGKGENDIQIGETLPQGIYFLLTINPLKEDKVIKNTKR